ncbi:MAG: A/G-specific adenine glycosylase [Firmicutes bacterium]|nr:A/G-specific adenine glycosylase [Bacillota bacterium]
MQDEFTIAPVFVPLLTDWYKQNARALPWRETPANPYRVWVSEIMLQQTRVHQAIGYFERFTKRFTDIASLAAADEGEVLKLWEGLGYYSRARNLKRAAETVAAEYGGQLPADYNAIRRLKGIGDYTAAALCAICFNMPAAAVDGNVLRVITRVCASEADIADPKTKRVIAAALRPLYETAQNRGELLQAMMELGALICTPKPKCGACPLLKICKAYALDASQSFPIKSAKNKKTRHNLTVCIVQCGHTYALRKRGAHGLLAGLYEFINFDGHLSESAAIKALNAAGLTNLCLCGEKTASHIFTHKIWDMRVYYYSCQKQEGFFLWENPAKVALPAAFKKLLTNQPDL